METLAKTEPKTTLMAFKVSASKNKEINDLCMDREWKVAAFIRVAIEKELTRLKNEIA